MNTFKLFWISANRQASMNMGDFDSKEAAEAAKPAALAELLAQCSSSEDRDGINAGALDVQQVNED
ncbi:hypothetical protein [Paucibacter soli]|uniref:hypothetical protein n=1 Tax=Paucibacter soli TaxID=3133433 RepID=UPI003097E97E